MAENSKLKLIYILDIMRKTDEDHPMNATQLGEELQSIYGITAERKSIARDLKCLEDAGYQIEKCEDHNRGFYMVGQDFEDYELKILADAVGAAKFMTVKDSRALIAKIRNLATKEGESLIKNTSYMDDTLKTDDKKAIYNFDLLVRAIRDGRQVSFQYYKLGEGGVKELARAGYTYTASPYFLALHENEYYLIANLSTHDHATHFKVENIVNLEELDAKIRPKSQIEEFKGRRQFNIADYLRHSVNMFNGETVKVTLTCDQAIRGDIIKKFGKDVTIVDQKGGRFKTILEVTDNDGFYQWCKSYGTHVKIMTPKSVRTKYITYIDAIREQY